MAQSDFLTQQHLDSFKALFPEDSRLQSLSLSELLANTQDVTPAAMLQEPAPEMLLGVPSASTVAAAGTCVLAVGNVVIDALCLITGAIALRGQIVKTAAQAVGEAIDPIKSKLEQIIGKMAASNATKLDIATGLGDILKEIHKASLFKAVWKAFKGALTWYYAVLYGVVALATIVALFATEGLAIIAEIVLLLAACAFMAFDIASAISACAIAVTLLTAQAPPAPPAPGNPFVTEPHGAFVTGNGHYLTFTNGGGLANAKAALNTNATKVGDTEQFVLLPVDPTKYSFAIKFINVANTFLSATNGGGMSCDDPTDCPVQTYSTTLGTNETVALVQLPNGFFAICLPNGNYLSAGNLTDPVGGPVTATVTQTLGANETFTFRKLSPVG